jgi:hypothetical protein
MVHEFLGCVGGAIEDLCILAGHVLQVTPAHAFGGQLDGRQRILDFVREATGHLAPGRVALRLQQSADVIEDNDVAALRGGIVVSVVVAR